MTGGRIMTAVQNRLESALGSGKLPTGIEQRGAQLLARLKSPVSVVVMGPPGSGKSGIVNMLAGQTIAPDGVDLPVLEVVRGPAPRTIRVHQDGTREAVDGVALGADLPVGVVQVRVELPAPVLDGMSLTEIRVSGTYVERNAAVQWATERADMVLWCTESFGPVEQELWSTVPDALKDHSFLILTKADQLLMKGKLEGRIAKLQSIVSEEFFSLFPVATLQALAARGTQGTGNAKLWKASGGKALTDAVLKQVETGRIADADNALVFLSRYAGDIVLNAVPVATTEPAAPTSCDGPAKSLASGAGAGVAHGALDFLAARAADLTRSMPKGGSGREAFILEHCLSSATGLADMLMQAGSDAGDLGSGAVDGMDMLLLMQLEQTGDAAEDALTLLLQLKKELTENAAAPCL